MQTPAVSAILWLRTRDLQVLNFSELTNGRLPTSDLLVSDDQEIARNKTSLHFQYIIPFRKVKKI